MKKQVKFNLSVYNNGMDYASYDALLKQLTEKGASTGANQSDAFVNYTKLSERRMHRWNKTLQLSPDFIRAIRDIDFKVNMLGITESWCGDAAHNLPIFQKITEENANFSLRLILRDEHEEVIDAYLTNGGRSIPKIIGFTEDGEELFTWGPRPEPAQELYLKGKAAGKPYSDLAAELQSYYNQDKGKTAMNELRYLLGLLKEKSSV
jgi:hypothetical protein